jgi:RNA polymerase sigma-70 factor, ECF subfamily
MNPNDLLADIRAGRNVAAAKEDLYGLVREALLDRLRARIPPRLQSRMDADDVVQAAFLRALKALDSFQPRDEDSFFAWVYRIGTNLIIDQGKRKSVAAVRFARGEEEGGPRESQVGGRGRRAETQLARKEWIESMLGRLKDREAEIIRLRWLEGKSFDEIAAAWGKTPGAVQRFHSRAWERLRELAEDEEEAGATGA